MRRKPIVAIDGPAGAGKSTVARAVADRIGFLYLDTGAMYRAITLKSRRLGLTPEQREELVRMAQESRIEFDDSGRRIFLDGEEVTAEIRSPQVDKVISDYVRIPELRHVVVEQQRRIGKNGGIVIEGRDIGTVVFPDAEVKVFLDATPRVRAFRRWQELRSKGIEVDIEEIERDIVIRDLKDSTREDSPLKAATDAVRIDTSDLTIEQVVERIISLMKGA